MSDPLQLQFQLSQETRERWRNDYLQRVGRRWTFLWLAWYGLLYGGPMLALTYVGGGVAVAASVAAMVVCLILWSLISRWLITASAKAGAAMDADPATMEADRALAATTYEWWRVEIHPDFFHAEHDDGWIRAGWQEVLTPVVTREFAGWAAGAQFISVPQTELARQSESRPAISGTMSKDLLTELRNKMGHSQPSPGWHLPSYASSVASPKTSSNRFAFQREDFVGFERETNGESFVNLGRLLAKQIVEPEHFAGGAHVVGNTEAGTAANRTTAADDAAADGESVGGTAESEVTTQADMNQRWNAAVLASGTICMFLLMVISLLAPLPLQTVWLRMVIFFAVGAYPVLLTRTLHRISHRRRIGQVLAAHRKYSGQICVTEHGLLCSNFLHDRLVMEYIVPWRKVSQIRLADNSLLFHSHDVLCVIPLRAIPNLTEYLMHVEQSYAFEWFAGGAAASS